MKRNIISTPYCIDQRTKPTFKGKTGPLWSLVPKHQSREAGPRVDNKVPPLNVFHRTYSQWWLLRWSKSKFIQWTPWIVMKRPSMCIHMCLWAHVSAFCHTDREKEIINVSKFHIKCLRMTKSLYKEIVSVFRLLTLRLLPPQSHTWAQVPQPLALVTHRNHLA